MTESSRELSFRERAVLAWMIDHARCHDPEYDEAAAGAAARARWRAQLLTTRAGRPCDCKSCPSIELTNSAGRTPDMTISRVVLEASVEGALLLLFIDDDQLSYLELAANDASSLHEFPEPGSISST